jgi:hypothetical protein
MLDGGYLSKEDFAVRRAAFFLCALSAFAQMYDPGIDPPGQPFCYPSRPTDVIGVRDAPEATEITPEGYLYTGHAELVFLLGYPAQMASQRVRTLEKGYLPVISYQLRDGAVAYTIEAFNWPLAGDEAARNPVNFVRVTAKNTGAAPRTAYFNAGMRATGEREHRFRRQARFALSDSLPGLDYDFNPNWEYAFQGDVATRSGHAVYLFPSAPKPHFYLTPRSLYSAPRRLAQTQPDAVVLMAQYALKLAPGASQTLVFKMPQRPMAASGAAALEALRAADWDDYHRRTGAWWEKELARGIQIQLAERKVTDTFRANLIYDMIAREKREDGSFHQGVNKFQYPGFYLRDGAYFVRAYDLAGYPDLAEQCLDYFFRYQLPDGNFVSQRAQFDGWGQATWAFGAHYRITRKKAWADRAFPAVKRAVEWLKQARAADPLHLMPASNPRDAEFTRVAAHITGYNLWALCGLRNAIHLARATGADEDARAWQAEYDDYARTLFAKLDQITAKTNGYMPPGIDQPNGQDWGNMLALYPEQLLPHFDRKVTGTLETTRAKYREGLMVYAGWMHHYLTMKNTETLTVRGEQRKALDELYAMLAHTTATHAGFETSIRPGADRDFGGNLTPHGWFGAKYIAVIRNMLLREEEDSLHLLSVLAPAWTAPGSTLRVAAAPTNFGTVAFQAAFREGGMTLDLAPNFEIQPAKIVVHLPWYAGATTATVDGKPAALASGALTVAPSARKIAIAWKRSPVAGLGYAEAVAALQKEYRARWQQFQRDGVPPEQPIVSY